MFSLVVQFFKRGSIELEWDQAVDAEDYTEDEFICLKLAWSVQMVGGYDEQVGSRLTRLDRGGVTRRTTRINTMKQKTCRRVIILTLFETKLYKL